MPINSSLSGVQSSLNQLGVFSNNLANLSTSGFKKSRAEFRDVVAAGALGGSGNAIGQGVETSSVRRQFTQGILESTSSALDLGIGGQGFFVLQDSSGSQAFSRAGSFHLDKDGRIVNSNQQSLVGFLADSKGQITGQTGVLQISNGDIAPKATQNIHFKVNLDPSVSTPSQPFPTGFVAGQPPSSNSYNFQSSSTVVDSLGTSHTLQTFFVKTANPNEFEVHVAFDGTEVGSGLLNFDDHGKLVSGSGSISLPSIDPGSGAAPLSGLTLDFTGSTQFSGGFSVQDVQQDGFASGHFRRLEIDAGGLITASFDNGRSQIVGQVALAQFNSPEELQDLGNNTFGETFASGTALVGAPDTGNLGLVHSGFLEQSNVDMAADLVGLIQAQRSFQANIKVIQTSDEVIGTLINLRS